MDEVELERQGWTSGELKVVRKLTREGDALNLVIRFAAESIDFDFNFNTAVAANANADARRAVETGRILRLRETAVNLMSDAYHFELGPHDDANG